MAIGKDKRRIMVTVPDWVAEEINQLAEEGGVSASALCAEMLTEAMPAFRQLRQAIQLAKKKQAKAYDVISEVMGEAIGKASQVQLGAFEEKAKLTKRPVKQHAPLSVGDWVRSIHSNRLGKVVKVYPDGSASICWRDGEPQGEGLGHERMPSELLKRSRAPR